MSDDDIPLNGVNPDLATQLLNEPVLFIFPDDGNPAIATEPTGPLNINDEQVISSNTQAPKSRTLLTDVDSINVVFIAKIPLAPEGVTIGVLAMITEAEEKKKSQFDDWTPIPDWAIT